MPFELTLPTATGDHQSQMIAPNDLANLRTSAIGMTPTGNVQASRLSNSPVPSSPAWGRGRIRKTDLLMVTSQLSIMCQSGIDLAEALRSVSTECRQPKLRKILELVYQDVRDGSPKTRFVSESEFSRKTVTNLMLATLTNNVTTAFHTPRSLGYVRIDMGTYSVKVTQVRRSGRELVLESARVVPHRQPLDRNNLSLSIELMLESLDQAWAPSGRWFPDEPACLLPLPLMLLRTIDLPSTDVDEQQRTIESELSHDASMTTRGW